jgi:transcriptional regulator with XRE-family HTH domain
LADTVDIDAEELGLRQRVADLIGECKRSGLSVREIANRIDVSEGTVRKYEKRIITPSAFVAGKIASIIKRDIHDVIYGLDISEGISGLARIPFADVRVYGGRGGENFHEENIATLDLPLSELNLSVSNPRHLVACRLIGPSMEGEIADGDIMLIDKGQQPAPNKKAIYMFRLDGALAVKYLTLKSRYEFYEESANKDIARFPPRTIKINDHSDFAVLGRVIWAGRRL